MPEWTSHIYAVTLGVILVAAGVFVTEPVAAELAILSDGRVLKVTGWEVGTERARLTLASGGVLTVSALRVERVIADEIAPEPEPRPAPSGIVLEFRDRQETLTTSYGALIHETARRHGVNPEVVAAMIRVESAFDSEAVSHAGARGLMQLMPATAARFGVGVGELFTPARNLEAGVRYVAWLIDRFGDDPIRVFAAYNAGERAVERYDGVPPYRETRGYVDKLLTLLGASTGGEAGTQTVAAAG